MPLSQINTNSLGALAITTSQIANNAVTAAQVANNTIGTPQLNNLTSANVSQINTSTGTPSFTTGSNTINFGTQSIGASSASTMKNRIINGAMVIDQRNAGASLAITSTNQYSVDRFQGNVTGGAGRYSLQQSSTAPAGFNYSLLTTVTTSTSSFGATDGYLNTQGIEGYNIADLNWGTANAKTVTLSFWVYSSVTGTFPICVCNNATNYNYGATYTISAINTWQQVSITIAGPTTGTWLSTNGAGIYLVFGLGGGSSRTLSTGWQSTAGYTPSMVTGASNFISNSGATLYLTGVQLEVGSAATSFDFRHYTQELQLCQRYYYQLNGGSNYPLGSINAYSSAATMLTITFPVTMRTPPTGITFTGNIIIYTNTTSYSPSSLAYDVAGNYSCRMNPQGSGFPTTGAFDCRFTSGGGTLGFTGAEL